MEVQFSLEYAQDSLTSLKVQFKQHSDLYENAKIFFKKDLSKSI